MTDKLPSDPRGLSPFARRIFFYVLFLAAVTGLLFFLTPGVPDEGIADIIALIIITAIEVSRKMKRKI